jgi:small subunit ribosomal protein S18
LAEQFEEEEDVEELDELDDESDEEEREESRPPRGRRQARMSRRPTGPRRRGGDRGRRARQCAFCMSKTSTIDYKQVDVLRPYVTERGKIRPRRQTGLCARHQRKAALAIKRARHLALLPFTTAGQGRFPA